MSSSRPRLTLVGLAVATLSCQLIIGLERPEGTPPVLEGPEVDAGPEDPCKHSRGPKAPAKDDDLDTKKSYWFAAQHLTAPLPKGGVPGGLDLDNACTCGADLHDGGPSCVSSKPICDPDGGVDDSLGSILGDIASSVDIDPLGPVNSNVARGSRTLLLYVADYNGKANDTDVRVNFVNAGGLFTNIGCDGNPRSLDVTYRHDGTKRTPSDRDRYAPAFDGCDRWSPAKALGPGRIPGNLVRGYVRDHTLVVPFDEVALDVFGNRATVSNVLMVATLVPEGERFRVEGVIAGRVPFEELLQAIGGGQVNQGFEDGGYRAACEDPFWALFMQQRLCDAKDVMAAASEDFLGRRCDAVSVQLSFTMTESLLSDFDFEGQLDTKVCPIPQCP